MHSSRELIVYIAMSLDGYIAGENDDLSFLNAVAAEGEDYSYQAFVDTVDTLVMGRKTYEVVKKITDEFPHQGRRVYVITQHQDFIISVIPVVLGKGTSLFASSDKSNHLQLEKSESWPSGLVQLNYQVIYPQG